MKCPHCKGELEEAPPFVNWKYTCLRCRRAWIVVGDYWLAGFDAGGHIYRVKNGKVTEIRRNNPLWQELWDKISEIG